MRLARLIGTSVSSALLALTSLSPAPATADGIRIGGFLQGTIVQSDIRETPAPVVPPDPEEFFDGTSRGIGGGISAGYDFRRGHWLFGIEGDIAFTGARANYEDSRYEYLRTATLRGRVGFDLHPGFLVYATGGVAMLGARYSGGRPPVVPAPAQSFDSELLFGPTFGVGFERDLHSYGHYKAVLFGEYLYADFERWNFTNSSGDLYRVDLDSHLVRVGVKIVFDR